jgi:hypothetical protein
MTADIYTHTSAEAERDAAIALATEVSQLAQEKGPDELDSSVIRPVFVGVTPVFLSQ